MLRATLPDAMVVLDLTISPLDVTASSTACSAYDSYDGTATAVASGGNTPYTYTWNTLPVQTGATASGLHAGDYTVNVVDAKGCITSFTVTVTQPGYVCEPFRTYAKGGWGAVNNGFNPGTYLINNFSNSYPNGLQIGACNRFIKLNSAAAVTAFLPTSGTPARLPNGTLVNPTATSYKNTLAGHLVALNLNITIDSLNPSFAASTVMFKNAIIAQGPFAGYTVQQLYNEANQAIGCSNNKTYLTRLNTALDSTNASWRNGLRRNNYVVCPGTSLARVTPFQDLSDQSATSDIIAFPNPSSGIINLRTEGELPTRIELYTILGECIINSSWQNQLDLTTRSNGLYILKARYADGSSVHSRVELQR